MNNIEVLFLIFALIACLGAIAVVVSQNVVRMAFWLMVSLGSVAGLFFLLRADFVAAAQLLIYVGGTVVLLVFGVMLTASGPFTKIKASPAEGFLAAGIGSLFLAMIIASVAAVNWRAIRTKLDPDYAALVARTGALFENHADENGRLYRSEIPEKDRPALVPLYDRDEVESFSQDELVAAMMQRGYNQRNEGNTARPLGLAFLGLRPDGGTVGYLLPFEIVSVHLLVVLIGAAYLARAKKRTQPEED